MYPPLGDPFRPAVPSRQAFLSFPASQTDGGISEQASWLWVVVTVRDCGAEPPRAGGANAPGLVGAGADRPRVKL